MVAIRSLDAVVARLKADFGFTPVLACEIEFYTHGMTQCMDKEAVVSLITEAVIASSLPLAKVNTEIGQDQFEVSFLPSDNAQQIITDMQCFKTLMQDVCAKHNAQADFSAKPFADRPGSGLHVHLHLLDASGKNCFTRAGRDMVDPFSVELLHSIGGLLALMNPCMKFFAPTEDSYRRFTKGANVPTTVSWGTNNRTVAVRLPTKGLDNKHLEHRVAGSDADVVSVLWAILAGVHYGLTNACVPDDPIYGDASLPQYNLLSLATNLTDAEKSYLSCKALQHYIEQLPNIFF